MTGMLTGSIAEEQPVWQGAGGEEDQQFFFEKRTKKLFRPKSPTPSKVSPKSKSFLVLFFKKGLLALPSLDLRKEPAERDARQLEKGWGE